MHVPVDRATKTKDHRTAVAAREEGRARGYAAGPIDAEWLRSVALAAGADDVGFASLENPALEEERPYASEALPGVRSFVSFCIRLNRDNIRSPARSLTNNEWHAAGDRIDEVGRTLSMRLQEEGYRAANPSMAFPQEIQRYPNRMWVVSHKKVAVTAGLGHMGLNRNVLHPRFGTFILLGTILLAAEISEYSQPLEWNPCLGCNLCVAACPVGAIKTEGEDFDFLSCYTHNYREFMGGFTDWVDRVADSDSAEDYQERVSDQETASIWQSLSYKPGYKAAYCVSVCPSGDDVIGPFLDDRKAHVRDVVKPLQEKREAVYVQPGSPADEHVHRRFPHKTPRYVSTRLRPPTELVDPGPDVPSESAHWPRPSVESYEDPDGRGRVVLHEFRRGWDGQVISYERRLPPGSGKARPHVHKAFAQRFTVTAGQVRYRLGREAGVLGAGEELVVEPGVVHLDPYNAFDEPAVVTNTVSPASAFAAVWARTLGQAIRDGIVDEQQEFRLLHLMLLLSHDGAETFAPGVPVVLQRRVVIPLLARLARRRGYHTATW